MALYTGNEHFTFDEEPESFLLNDFWAWQSSDLLCNTIRGVLAEFIVYKALGLGDGSPRKSWSAYDILFAQRKIEVKSSAYLQSDDFYNRNGLSRISFSIKPTKVWEPIVEFSEIAERQSDMYIFCILKCQERSTADPLNLNNWEFYILPTSVLNEQCNEQKTISLPSLIRIGAEHSDFRCLHDRVTRMLLVSSEQYNSDDVDTLTKRIEEYEVLRVKNDG